MNLTNLKAKVAGYLQRQVSDLVVNGVDLCLDAVNSSRQWALKQYDFEYAKASVDVSVSLTAGAPISPLYLHGTTNYVTVKKVLNAFIADGAGGIRPIKFTSRSSQVEDSSERWRGVPLPFAPVQRDVPTFPSFSEPWLVQVGNQLMLYPASLQVFAANPVPVFLDVIRYFPDYKDSDDNVDFLLQFGDDFLFWDAVCRLNKLAKEFVPRQEGNLPEPTTDRDRAWQDLLAWDAQLITTGDSLLSLD